MSMKNNLKLSQSFPNKPPNSMNYKPRKSNRVNIGQKSALRLIPINL